MMVLIVVCVLFLPHVSGRVSADLRLRFFKAVINGHDEIIFVVVHSVRSYAVCYSILSCIPYQCPLWDYDLVTLLITCAF